MTKPTVPDVLPLVRRLYKDIDVCSRGSGCVGGHLHIVLDDCNVEDGHVAYCYEQAKLDDCDTCVALCKLLLEMSKTQRSKLANMDHYK